MNHLPMEVPPTYDIAFAPVRAYHENAVGNTLRALWRGRGLVLAALALSLLISGAILKLEKKQYAAQAMVQLDLGQEDTPTGQQNARMALEASAVVQGEASIIRSRVIARRVVQQMGLEIQVPEQTWWDQAVGFFGSGGSSSDDPANDRLEAVITALLSQLSVTTDNRSYLIEINYTAGDPTSAAHIANAFARQYLERRNELNQNLTGHVTEWLRGQIDSSTAALNRAEQAVIAYRQQTHLVDAAANGETIYQQQLRELGTQLTAARLARTTEETRAARVRQMVASGIPPSAADVPGSTLIQDLLEQEINARQHLNDLMSTLGSQNPQFGPAKAALSSAQQALATQMRNAVATSQASASAAAALEEDLKDRFDALQKAMVSDKANEIELEDLQTKAQTIRQRLSSLAQRYDQALAEKNLQLVAGSLVVPAEVVPIPSQPKPLIVITLALVCGGIAGVLVALLLERRDRGFRTIGEVNALTGLRCLAMLPELPVKRPRRKRNSQTAEEVIFEERIRAVGAGIGLFGSITQECRVVLVTSSLSREGKSTICQGLARLLAGVGHRVLLIDSARSQEHRKSGAPIIEDYDNPTQSMVVLSVPSVEEKGRFVRRGSTLMSEVYGPEKLDRLIDDARKHFDVVLIDGTPVMLLADTFVIGRKADAVLHVIQWGKTLKSTVMTALQQLREQSIRVDATVLARVES
jgi:polysaccharide biosynthesis transport protein